MKYTSITVALLVGAISLTDAINIKQDKIAAEAVVDATPATTEAVISETPTLESEVTEVEEPESATDVPEMDTPVDDTPTERDMVQGDDRELIEQVKSFGQDGEVYGVCSSVSHPFAKMANKVFSDVEGDWKTLFIDRGMFD